MNHTHITRLILAALLVAMVVMAVITLPGGTSSSAGEETFTRVPRPHPQSHIQLVESDHVTRSPRPHPMSHIEMLVARP